MSTLASESTCVMDRLRSETRPHHDRAEESGFGTLVMEGGLTRDHYVPHLLAWRRILGQLEQALRSSENPVVREVWHEGLAKLPMLEADIDHLSPGGTAFNAETATAVNEFVAFLEDLREHDPVALLGVLYVLEGSTMGGSVMKPRIASQLGLEGDDGLRYYGVYGKEVGLRFKDFRSRMAEAANGTGAEDRIIEAAKSTFDGVSAILRTLVTT